MYKLLSDYSDHWYKHAHSGTIDYARYIPAIEFNGVRYIAKMTVVVSYDTGDTEPMTVKTQFNFEQVQFPNEMIDKIYADYLAAKDEKENENENQREKEGERE